MERDTLAWQALEYDHKPKTADWFWILGAIVLFGSVLAFYFGNFFFGVFILVAGLTVALHANIPPSLHSYSIQEEGLVRDDALFPFRNITGYTLTENFAGEILLLEVNRLVFPIVTIPLRNVDKDWIRQIFRVKNIKEKELTIPLAERIMDAVGF